MNTPSYGLLLRVWFLLGLQSFGGGGATLALIRRTAIDHYGWMTEAEFVRDWTLCQVAPGINLLALTILIGRRLAGGAGIFLCLLGLLLPSVTLTLMFTAFYSHYRELPAVRAALRAVIPATVGIGLVTAWGMARPLLAASRRQGKVSLGFGLVLLLGAGVAALWHPPVILVLCAAGVAGALFGWGREEARKRRTGQRRAGQ